MTLKEIENQVSQHEEGTIMTHKQEITEKRVLEMIVKCIKNNIKIDLTENDIVRIANMYYDIYHKYNLIFLKQIAKYSTYELDFYKILNKLT